MNTILQAPQILDRELVGDEIHVWCASLDRPVSGFQRLLSEDERTRAERYHFEEDRRRFIVRRGILRTLLSGYLGIEPYQVKFCYGKNGKPGVPDIFGKTKVQFNLSRSEGLVLYAFTRNHEIGVDIEYVREIPGIGRIAKRFFSARENSIFQSLPESQKKEAFFNCWTRKEAFIKAIGDGLLHPLDSFDVSLVPGEPARLIGIKGDFREASRWSLRDLQPAVGFSAALAVKGPIEQVYYQQWSD
jgi:4'-phosphopantetheinyl transferase